ncbi:MAG: glutamine--fructose-6-phosphate transaminase (isomerizing) [Gammaproteobacteria bacterium]|nr:glutamine--fructose-6-phosphate transaminase (isomerizing) [Gammaproteobacteria bacterium]
MCGIVGAVAQRDVTPILLEGLRRLEYRGYDSAGVALINNAQAIQRVRATGKVSQLEAAIEQNPVQGVTGIAHTRWATHGKPSDANAHPHVCRNNVAVVHNGIIENHDELREQQLKQGYEFTSETDTEVIVHQIHYHQQQGMDLLAAVQATIKDLKGAYGLGVISNAEPGRLIAARSGSPLVVGVGIGEMFIASDVPALLPVTQRFVFLEEGDIVDLTPEGMQVFDVTGSKVERQEKVSELSMDSVERGQYRHYMMKEIHEQPRVIADALEGRLGNGCVLSESFGPGASEILAKIQQVQIVACGTSYHAGLVTKYWLEALAGVPCEIEVASEFRYRSHVVRPNTLFVTISQSGETADTLAALREAKKLGFQHTLAICNVPESSLVRESELVMMTRAGPEIGVASTKAFTTQLTVLLLMVVAIGKHHGLDQEKEKQIVQQLIALPARIEHTLTLSDQIKRLSERFADKQDALFLGRGVQYPVAMEGALKLKEISYIHAEAYAAGELKHGPLALVDADMPVIAVAPNNALLEKLKSNLQEVRARGGELYVFADQNAGISEEDYVHVIEVDDVDETDAVAPIVYTVPLQLLSYHVAVLKGTDVDQPRNLAKSVTVE